jgi:hypothetical protein
MLGLQGQICVLDIQRIRIRADIFSPLVTFIFGTKPTSKSSIWLESKAISKAKIPLDYSPI